MSFGIVPGSAVIEKSIETTRALLEKIASNNYHWSGKRANLKRSGGGYEVDVVDLLASKVDALA